jgi:hypothetical protein
VTGRAILSKRALVEIIRGMAGITISGRALELQIRVTLAAENTSMRASQLED